MGIECDSIAECALRFTISFDAVTCVIPGMRNTSRVIENVDIINKGPVSARLIENLKTHKWERNYYKS